MVEVECGIWGLLGNWQVMSAENLEFKWGKKRDVGGKKKEAQFYGSFIFDDVEYELYDCVYMWKDDEPEPFVGKIIKIWEDKTKKVKILWFFKPSEIFNCLDDAQTSENELILGSGEGPGLSNINPLEAIAGKCNVICIAKDDRNPQPTNEELQGADYVFYRIFDVKQLTISENIPDTIAAIHIKCIFNRREGQQPSVSTTPGTENLVSNDICGSQTENGDRFNYHKPSEGKSNAVQKSDAVMNSHLQDKDDDNELYGRPFKKPKLDSSVNLPREKTENDLNVRSDGTISPKSAGDEKANVTLDVSNDIVSKALKVETHVVAGEIKGKSKLARESNATDVVLPKEGKLDEEVRTLANGEIPTDSNQMLNKQEKLSSLVMEVTRSPGADKKGWFRQLILFLLRSLLELISVILITSHGKKEWKMLTSKEHLCYLKISTLLTHQTMFGISSIMGLRNLAQQRLYIMPQIVAHFQVRLL